MAAVPMAAVPMVRASSEATALAEPEPAPIATDLPTSNDVISGEVLREPPPSSDTIRTPRGDVLVTMGIGADTDIGALEVAPTERVSSDDVEARASLPDDDPTPFEPPKIDLGALDAKAAAMPPRPKTPVRSAPNDFTAGERFRSYLVLGPLAEGGLSWLYEVTHADTRERAVLKVLKPWYRTDRVLAERMYAEGRLVKSMPSNPYVCRVHEVGFDERLGYFVVMDHLRGRPLSAFIQAARIAGKPMGVNVALHNGITVGVALHALHMGGTVHRDLKPDNIFVVEHVQGQTSLKLLDFGAAKSEYSPRTSHEDSTIGTIGYMAPEQTSRKPITQAADQYALACIIYEMIFRRPFADQLGHLPPAAQLLGLHLHEPVPKPPPHVVPPSLWAILGRALEKDPSKRYPSMLAFTDALRDFLASDWKLEPVPAVLAKPIRATVPSQRMLEDESRGIYRREPPDSRPEPVLPAEPPEPRAKIPVGEPHPAATLLVFAPPALRGQRFALGKEGVIGRHPGIANVVLEHDTVSNEHLSYSVVHADPERPVSDGQPIEMQALRPDQILELGDAKLCLLPAGSISEDLKVFQVLKNTIPNQEGGEGATPKRPKRKQLDVSEPWRKPTLVVTAPADIAGLRFDMGVRGIVGRDELQADVVILDESVSRAHFEYSLVTGGERFVFTVRDLGSSNKVVAIDEAGQKRAIQNDVVFDGETIKIGGVELAIRPPGYLNSLDGKWVQLGEGKSGGRPQLGPRGTIVDKNPPKKVPDPALPPLANQPPDPRRVLPAIALIAVLVAITVILGYVALFRVH